MSLQLYGTAHELLPQDLQSVSEAKVCTAHTKENMLKGGKRSILVSGKKKKLNNTSSST